MQSETAILSIFEGNMARRRGQRKGYLFQKGGWWNLQYRVDTPDLDEHGTPVRAKITVPIAQCTGPEALGKREAQRIAWDEYLSRLDQSSMRPSSMKTLAQFVTERFEPDVVDTCKPKGKLHYAYMLKNHVLPALGKLRLREIGVAQVQNLINAKLHSGLSVQTAVHIRNCISAVLRHAKHMGWFAGEVPTEAVRMPEMRRKEKRALRWEQVCEISKVCAEPVATLVPFLALTGLRIGEAMGLRWRCLNLTDKPVVVNMEVIPPYCIAVRENFVLGQYQSLKTSRSSRNVPIPDWFVPRLQTLFVESKWKGPDDPVFAALCGKPLDSHHAAARQLKPAAAACGLGTPAVKGRAGKPTAEKPRVKKERAHSWVGWHSFRHTNATLAAAGGMSVVEQQRILGHSSAATTLHYSHADLDQVRERWNRMVDGRKLLN